MDIKNEDVSMGKDQANRLLKLGISILRGGHVIEPTKGRIGDCLFLMNWMRREGMWWQADRLQNWLHRCQGGEFERPSRLTSEPARQFTWKNLLG